MYVCAGVTEAMLETVIPRSSGSKVMIVGGANKGKVLTKLILSACNIYG